MKIERDERELLKIPVRFRPGFQFVAEILFQKFLEAGVVKSAGFQLCRRLVRCERLRRVMHTAGGGNEQDGEQDGNHPTFNIQHPTSKTACERRTF